MLVGVRLAYRFVSWPASSSLMRGTVVHCRSRRDVDIEFPVLVDAQTDFAFTLFARVGFLAARNSSLGPGGIAGVTIMK